MDNIFDKLEDRLAEIKHEADELRREKNTILEVLKIRDQAETVEQSSNGTTGIQRPRLYTFDECNAEVLKALQSMGPMPSTDIATSIGFESSNGSVHRSLRHLREEGKIARGPGGVYHLL
jgi:hypothetical protein